MNDTSRGGIFIVNPATCEAEPITSEELAVRKAKASESAPVKPATRKRQEELTDGTTQK